MLGLSDEFGHRMHFVCVQKYFYIPSRHVIIIRLLIFLPALIPYRHVLVQFIFKSTFVRDYILFFQVEFHPWVLLHLLQIHPLLGIADEYLRHELLSLLGDILPRVVLKIILAIFDLLKQLEVVLVVEGRRA